MTKNKGGRPLKFKTVKELEDIDDGFVEINTKNIENDNFNKEKDLLDYLTLNINKFCEDFLNDDLISFETEYQFQKQERFLPRNRRIDLYIIGKKNKYLIELKNPVNLAENRYAIGQLLDYGREITDSKKELILITTKFDINTAKTIEFYSLPIRYIYLDKKRILEFYKTVK